MKFNNILVVLNPDNEKQYALARAVRLVKEQQNETKVKITTLLVFMTYRMRCQPFFLLKNAAKCIKQPLNNNVKPYNFI